MSKLSTYTYPPTLGQTAEQGQHFMILDSYESKNAIDSKGPRISSIALYIPANALSTTFAQNYEGMNEGSLMAFAGRGITEITWNNIAGGIKAAASAGGVNNLKDLAISGVTKGAMASNFLSAGLGLARNNHVALVYKGPSQFREHTFVFNFFPKEQSETEIVRGLIQDLQDGSTPRLVGSSGSDTARITAPFFASPRQWNIKFCMGEGRGLSAGENEYLLKINRSVITTMTVNHDPQSIVGFHSDGSPVQTQLSITFKELEYVTSKDKASKMQSKAADAHAQKSAFKNSPDFPVSNMMKK